MTVSGMLIAAAALAAPFSTSLPEERSGQKQVAVKDSVAAVQAASDTVPKDSVVNLRDVTVEGQTQRVIAHGVEYIPGARQKKSAISGADLLLRMGIPQLNVTPGSESVTDNFGNAVDFFINGNPATQEEVRGLRTVEVKAVQYLENPTDPRYRNALRAINFIVRKMEWGGYTKLQANQSALAGTGNYGTLFSKFAYKAMTYDLYGQASHWGYKHNGADREVEAVLPASLPGEHKTVTQVEKAIPSRFKNKNFPLSFRAFYDSKKLTVSNRISFGHWNVTDRIERGTLTSSALPGEEMSSFRNSPERENTFSYAGDLFLTLPRNYSLIIRPTFQTSRIHSDYEYNDTRPASTEIVRRAAERTNKGDFQGILQTTFTRLHYACIALSMTFYDAKTDYTGNTVFTNRYRYSQFYPMLSYAYHGNKLYLNPKVGFYWRKTTENNVKRVEGSAIPNLTAQYTFNSRHSVYAYVQYMQRNPSISSKVGELFQQTDLLWTKGNPDLKPYHTWLANASYNWIPSNTFSLRAYGQASAHLDKVTALYEHQPGIDGVVRGFHNDGDYKKATAGVSATLRLLDNSLQFSVTPEGIFTKTTGLYRSHLNQFTVQGYVSYYWKGFYASAFYRTRSKEFLPLLNQYTRNMDSYSLQAGWGNYNWNLRLEVFNIFKKNWVGSTTTVDTPIYKESLVNYGSNGHGSIQLTATYSFGYGKPVNRNEIGAMDRSESSIAR